MKDNKISLMLVDDDEVDVMSVQRAFKKINITNPLYIAHNGVEALALLRGENGPKIRPAIILLDLNMPRMGGLEFLETLRADPELKSICVIVLTTSRNERDKMQAFDYNVAGYIVKPITPGDFVEAMATFNKYWTLSETP
jgi:CheY-like chemotaxis protein